MRIKYGVLILTVLMFVCCFPVPGAAYDYAGDDDFVIQTVEVPQGKLPAMQQLIAAFAEKENITSTIYYGTVPKIVLCGSQESIQRLKDLMEELGGERLHGDLIYITATMQEATISGSSAIGVNISDIVAGGQMVFSGTSSNPYPETASWELAATSINGTSGALATARFRSGDGENKLLMAGQVVTTNGTPGLLKNIEQVPYQTVNVNGTVQLQYFNANTIISVNPSILEYNDAQPEKSKIKLDVEMQISVISSQQSLVATATPEVNTRLLKTSRVLNADNKEEIVATIVRDTDILVKNGLPVLGSIPVLKYLFSQETIEKQRVVSWLKLAVRFVPQNKSGESYLDEIRFVSEQGAEKSSSGKPAVSK